MEPSRSRKILKLLTTLHLNVDEGAEFRKVGLPLDDVVDVVAQSLLKDTFFPPGVRVCPIEGALLEQVSANRWNVRYRHEIGVDRYSDETIAQFDSLRNALIAFVEHTVVKQIGRGMNIDGISIMV